VGVEGILIIFDELDALIGKAREALREGL